MLSPDQLSATLCQQIFHIPVVAIESIVEPGRIGNHICLDIRHAYKCSSLNPANVSDLTFQNARHYQDRFLIRCLQGKQQLLDYWQQDLPHS
jgi:hypothetical protein